MQLLCDFVPIASFPFLGRVVSTAAGRLQHQYLISHFMTRAGLAVCIMPGRYVSSSGAQYVKAAVWTLALSLHFIQLNQDALL